MDLLNDIIRQPIDPDYAVVAARGDRRPPARGRWDLALVALVIGAIFTVAAIETTRSAPALETERAELITRIKQAEAAAGRAADPDRRGQRRDRPAADHGARRRRRGQAADQSQITDARAGDGRCGGQRPRHGDHRRRRAGDSTDSRDQVLDLDLQMLANGLWESGAEAISINGHRLSTLTAIRSAGDAITVDYRSLTRPYRVEAIGDPRTLPARWVESSGGAWWNELAQNRRMRYEVSTVDELALAADPGMTLRYAKVHR